MMLYYTDPLQAAWMHDKFGVRFLQYPTPEQVETYDCQDGEPWDWLDSTFDAGTFEETVGDAIKFIKDVSPERIYVHPDDYGVFSMGHPGNAIIERWLDVRNRVAISREQVLSATATSIFVTTDVKGRWIDDKLIAFFMPEVEL
jgi:hypothetical protein